jgi:NAD+ kinase
MTENIPRTVQRAVLFINLHKGRARALGEEIIRELGRRGIEADSCTTESPVDIHARGTYDIAFSLGGDGTVLFAARTVAPLGVPILPVNLGTLGFIASVQSGEWLEVFEDWLLGRAAVSPRLMLEARVERGGSEVARLTGLNEMIVSASGIAKIVRLRVESESISLGQYRSDGLILATPTGSTAYSVAAGGPILDPELEALIINPICPFTLRNRPIVASSRETIIVEVEPDQRTGVILTADGQAVEKLEMGDRLYVKRAPFPGLLIGSDRPAFYRALRTKLSWSGGTES